MVYSEVVEKAKIQQKYLLSRGEYRNNKIQYVSCSEWENGAQINLWTYWQGYQIKDVDKGVDILLVGQDWGSPSADSKTIEFIRLIQSGTKQAKYFKEDGISDTDKNLVYLFKHCFQCNIKSNFPGKRLFFTNYSLGYRKDKQTGDMTKGLLRKDKELFEDLVTAIKPKIIICLGKDVFEVVSGRTVKGFTEYFKTEQKPFVRPFPNNESIPVYGVPHCGYWGIKNAGGMDNVTEIWRYIAKHHVRTEPLSGF
ncbi:MAG: hypothetical protein IKN95_10495 [Lachnospiraceae bacterium]|nr:hypothetical protein [Lachnospiraceae bacterium]